MTEVTVIRRIVRYEEMVFDSREQFEEWKSSSRYEDFPDETNEEWLEFNQKKFVDMNYYELTGDDLTDYVALDGDETDKTDDWIFWGIFNVESWQTFEIENIKIYEKSFMEFVIN